MLHKLGSSKFSDILIALLFALFFTLVGIVVGDNNADYRYNNMQLKNPMQCKKKLYFNKNNEVDTFYIYKFSDAF